MKKIAIAIILFCTLYSAYSLDYRQVLFGNNYQNILEIDADAFFKQYPAVKEFTVDSESGWTNYARVYEQIIGETTFYRVLFKDEKLTEADFLDWKNTNFLHFVFFKKSNTDLLQCGGYAFRSIDASDNSVYTGLEIIERNNNVIGLMEYTVPESGSSNNKARYWSWQNIVKAETEWEPTLFFVYFNSTYIETIEITASNALIDSKRPFMYTIQNAFDGNPATSYVEDTDDDLMTIQFDFTQDYTFTNLAIINGYAQSESIYQSNNRVKTIIFPETSTGNENIYNLDGNTLEYQEFTLENPITQSSASIDVTEIYAGTKYSDTSLAELDMYIEGDGWLFGLQ